MNTTSANIKRFHGLLDTELSFQTGEVISTTEFKYFIIQEREVGYRFYLHQHPYVQQLVQRLIRKGTPELQAADTDYVKKTDGTFETLPNGRFKPTLYSEFFEAVYNPNGNIIQENHFPVNELDFSSSGAYSAYNWELFYHVPITVAIHLSKNQRFNEAQRWFHFLFDPTDNSDGPTPERFWKVRPFQYTDVKKIEEILTNLATGADTDLRNETIRAIEAWQDAPFRPHLVARYRQQAYMIKTVMSYLDHLIAWGDSLFLQDTGEAIDEALQLYVLAANILGPRPQAVPKKGTIRPQTYANLRKDLRQFGTVLRNMEADIPFDLLPLPSQDSGENDRLATLRSLGKALYFCVPRNDKLLSYWDTVSDRLFKIRNSLNIQGVFRQLALFEPPIDPALLARATATGLDVGAVLNGLNQPLPLVRFIFLVQKAAEIAQEVKSLGNNLLSAMEKQDHEALAILRAKHENMIMEMVEHVKYGQLQAATKSKEALLQSLALAVQSYTWYERQLGKTAEEVKNAIPELEELDKESLAKMKFHMTEPIMPSRELEPNIAKELGSSGGKVVSSYEKDEIDSSHKARDWQERSSNMATTASASYYVPQYTIDFHYWGLGGTIEFGGKHIAPAFQATAEYFKDLSSEHSFDASHASKIGGYERREKDWTFKSNQAAGEINNIFKQLRAAQIREAVAEQELKNHQQQMKHTKEIEQFLNEEGYAKKGQKTHKAFYTWMKREVKGLYSQSFQFAFDIAKKAERALKHELGESDVSYLKSGYLAGKEGLLAGEKLYLDIKRMELAYHELNQREYELTKHISLRQVDPLALIQLRTTGKCMLRLPEELFDMDGPGHYFRRIKSVALSIPCISGPYAHVNCTLTLQKSSIRTNSVLHDGNYMREDAEDARFNDYFGTVQSIVTSSAQQDSGLFETNLKDERYLPFENAGAISEWHLQLPADPSKKDPAQFDYDSISDVILHVRYTAREGGALLRRGAISHFKALISEAKTKGSQQLFSIRHEFPSEWARFKSQLPHPNQRFELALNLRPEHYPFWSQNYLDTVSQVDVFARSSTVPVPSTLDIYNKGNDQPDAALKDTLSKDAHLGNLLVGSLSGIPLPASPVGELKLYFDDKDMEDFWLIVRWGSS